MTAPDGAAPAGALVVTGAASGIGRALATQLVARGHAVIGVDRAVGDLPGGVTGVGCDLARPGSVADAASQVLRLAAGLACGPGLAGLAEVLAASRDAAATGRATVARGLGASPGRVSGAAALDADAAAAADGPVVLVRPETSPQDVHGMSVSVGILTSTGGLVSHAAVVARGWGLPAVVGAADLVVGEAEVRDRSGAVLFRAGNEITVDGTTGEVWVGRVVTEPGATQSEDDVIARLLPELAVLEAG